jgi:hypothetical protein
MEVRVSSPERRAKSLYAHPRRVRRHHLLKVPPVPADAGLDGVVAACEGQRRAMAQLGRILLSGSSGSQEEPSAAPEGSCSYGELMDEIDRLIESSQTSDPDGGIGSRAESLLAAFTAACRSIHALRSGCEWACALHVTGPVPARERKELCPLS